jgi:hypothetical protein
MILLWTFEWLQMAIFSKVHNKIIFGWINFFPFNMYTKKKFSWIYIYMDSFIYHHIIPI